MSRYVVGIDLGTTNSALAYADTREATADVPAPIRTLAIPQVVGVNDVAERPVLPSFLYLPRGQGVPGGRDRPALERRRRDRVVGTFAREHGAEGAGPAGQLGQELALARGRRSPRRDPALDRRRRRRQGLARRGVVGLPGAPPRRLEPPDRRQGRRRPARTAGRAPDRPRLVRRRGPRADRRGRARGRARERSRCWRSRRPRSTPGSPRRATAGGRRSRSATSSSSATSAAARPTSR